MVKGRVYKKKARPHVTHSNISGKGVHKKDLSRLDANPNTLTNSTEAVNPNTGTADAPNFNTTTNRCEASNLNTTTNSGEASNLNTGTTDTVNLNTTTHSVDVPNLTTTSLIEELAEYLNEYDSVDKVGFERIIHQLKTVVEMKKVKVMGKGGRIKTNNRGRRKEKGVKSVYKVPPKEDKSVAEIMYDLQMAALDEVD